MARTAIVAFDSPDGPIYVEVEETGSGPVPAGRPGDIAGKAAKSFQEAVAGIRPIAQAVVDQLRELGPDETTVELGVKFAAQAGVVLASTDAEAQVKVTLKWKKP